MTSEIMPTPSQAEMEQPTSSMPKMPRVWPAVVLVGSYWIAFLVWREMELTTFVRFISSMAISAALTLGFLLWWLLSFRRPWSERLGGLAVDILGGIAAQRLYDDSLAGYGTIFMVPPYVVTSWTIWLLLARKASARPRLLGSTVVLLATWGSFALVRMDGISGDQRAAFHWRWTPTAGELYLQERAQKQVETGERNERTASELVVRDGDWPGFRGPDRDGVVHGLKIATDWKANPPKRLWRQRVGPGWSSLAVIDDRLFTQEQRGNVEAVVCLDAATGRELWSHEDAVRFWETVGGEGPRATPTFADGRLYALGATGILNCLDAGNGKRKWFRDLAADSGTKPPMWGFSSSPLVVQGLVVVFGGGEGEKQLLAYRADSGQLAWTAAVGAISYGSAQQAVLNGVKQILFWSDRGLTALDPASGKVLWRHDAATPGSPRSLQPHVAGKREVLISSETDLGTAFLEVKREGDSWTASRRWTSKRLQPSFNDFVIHDGSIYGFDGAMFCCVDLRSGARRWKAGRYGHGQVLLLADSSLLLVAAENGQVVLLEANPEAHKELGRFHAIEGKTWNHPAVIRGRLYLRNGEEIACYELLPQTSP